MNLKFANKKITGILTVLPRKEVRFDDEMENYNFTESQSMKLKKIMGYDKHRVVDDGVSSSDLAIAGITHLLNNNYLKKEDIDALIFVTQTPDYFLPATSFVVQGALGLKQDTYCLDINQGCAGYVIGLYQAFMLLEQETINKVLLVNVDVLSRKINKKDRNSYPLSGDGATITVVEKDKGNPSTIYANLKTDGTHNDALIIPAGGMRLPSTAETAVAEDDGKGNIRSKDNLVMKGDAVFNFVQTEVPPMIDDLLAFANTPKEQVDYFMFHQPNRFMLQKLADKMKVPYEKMPNNVVENFGNGSGITIPTAITFNLSKELKEKKYLMCLAGFGVGLTWGALLMTIGNLDFCEMIDY